MTAARRVEMFSYLRFHLVLEPTDGDGGSPAALAGPRVRRVLGKAFIGGFCPFGEPRCQPRSQGGSPPPPEELCELAKRCPYGVLFAASLTGRPPFSLFLPRPADSEPGILEITLYGKGSGFYAWALLALQHALRQGLGKKRRRWEIAEILRVLPDRRGERLCGGDLSALPSRLAPDLLGLAIEPYLAPQQVEVTLLSPTRLLDDGKLVPGHAPVPFKLLVARVLDRFRGLYGDDASEILNPGIREVIEAQAGEVRLLADETDWHEVADYSARSRSELLLGGKVGRLVYGEEAAPFFPILRAGEVLHVGKNPTSGCGRIAVDLRGRG